MLLAAANPFLGGKPVLKPAPLPTNTSNVPSQPRAPTYDAFPNDGLPSTTERKSESEIGRSSGNSPNLRISGNTLILAVAGIACIWILFSDRGK